MKLLQVDKSTSPLKWDVNGVGVEVEVEVSQATFAECMRWHEAMRVTGNTMS